MKSLIKLIIICGLIFNGLISLRADTSQNIWISVSISAPVHNVTKNIWHNTITDAVVNASNNNLIEVYPGTYNESINISGYTNLTVRAWAWTNNQDNTNTIVDGSGYKSSFIISNSKQVTILGFTITKATNGIYMTGTSVSNYIQRNVICSNETYGIYIDSDTADNNYILTNNIWGMNQDYGIYVNNGDNNIIITNDIFQNSKDGIYITGTASGNRIINNKISSNHRTGIYIASSSNVINNNSLLSNHQYGIFIINANYSKLTNNVITLCSNCVWITNSDFVTLYSNYIHHFKANGIYQINCNTNNIVRNRIASNSGGIIGIRVNGNGNNISYNDVSGINGGFGSSAISGFGDYNTFTNNVIHDNNITCLRGINIISGDNCEIIGNIIYGIQDYGIFFQGSYNNISMNTTYNIGNSGICMLDSNEISNRIYNNVSYSNGKGINLCYNITHTTISNNILFGNVYGIYGNPYFADIIKNEIFNNDYGINLIKNPAGIITNVNIFNNTIINNATNGIYLTNVKSVNIQLNNITNNQTGIYLDNNVLNEIITKNNIYTNSIYNFITLQPFTSITNNWWGVTSVTQIASMISNNGSYSNFIPYRLFGEFDITIGADTTNLSRVTWATAVVINNDDIVITWNQTSGGDFKRYNVYRTTDITLWSNLTFNDIWTQTSLVAATNITNYNLGAGTYYYYITAMDDAPYTNECWYSPEAMAIVVPASSNVWNISLNTYYDTIMSAVSNASNNNVIEVVVAQVYNEKILLSPLTTSATNLTIGSYSWWTNGTNTSTIISGNNTIDEVITISNGYTLKLEGFVVEGGAKYGIRKLGTGRCEFNHNIITNCQNGLLIQSGNSNVIFSNQIYDIATNAVTIAGGLQNVVKENKLFNCGFAGVWIQLGGENTVISNDVMYNDTGLYIYSTTYSNRMAYNSIFSNTTAGIIMNRANSNIIQYNDIYGLNQNNGILLYTNAGYNHILNNRIYDNYSQGISMAHNCDFNNITANTVYNHNSTNNSIGISLIFDNDNNVIYNNYIFSNLQNIVLSNNCGNNVITNNILIGTNVGIYLTKVTQNRVVENVIKGNLYGVRINYSSLNYLRNNKLTNNNYGISLEYLTRSNYIENNNITAGSNYGIFVYVGTNNFILNNQIESGGFNGIALVRSYQNYIKYNNIYQSGLGISLRSNNYFNEISYNTNYNNQYSGIMLYDLNENNYIAHNTLFSNNQIGSSNSGLILMNSSYNVITNNDSYGASQYVGILLLADSSNNRVVGNYVHGENYAGIVLVNNNLNYVAENNVSQNLTGIYFENVTSSTLMFNQVNSQQSNGIMLILSTNVYVGYNYIGTNNEVGLRVSDSNPRIELNTMIANSYGLFVTNSLNTKVLKNNIMMNSINNAVLQDSGTVKFTNTWWGSTIATQINNTISGLSYSNFIPYRLFGEFNIELGADTTNPSSVGLLTSQIVSITNVALSWNTSSGAVRYFVYSTNINSWSNFNRNKVIGVSSGTNWTNFNVPNGTNYWWVTALDDPSSIYTNETWYSASTFAVIDRTPPYFSNLSPFDGQVNVATNSDIVFNLFDNVSAVSQSIIVKIGGTTALSNGVPLAGYSAIIYASNTGWNVLVNPNAPFSENTTITGYAYGEDNSGNTNDIIWIFTTTDTSIPYFTNVSPTNNQVNVATNENIVFNIFDNVSVVSQSIIVRIDGITAFSNGSPNAGYNVNISASNTGWNVIVNPNNPFVEWTPVNVYLYGEDNNPNTNSMSFVFTTTDGTPPDVVNLISPTNNTITNGNNIDFLWQSSTDSGSGITNYRFQITNINTGWSTNLVMITTNTQVSSLAEGTNYWRVRAYDRAGNIGQWSSTNILVVDLTGPSAVNLIRPPDDIWTNSVSIEFVWTSANDALSGITNYNLFVTNNSGWFTNVMVDVTNIIVANIHEGTNQWNVIAYDRVGNPGQISSTNIVKVDTNMPPAVTLVLPVNNYMTNNSNIDFTWNIGSDTLSGVTNYRLNITNHGGWFTNIITTGTNYPGINVKEGTNYWKVYAKDRAGNIGLWSITNGVILDTVDPIAVNLISPTNNSILSNKTGGIDYEWTSGTDTGTGITNYMICVTNISTAWSTNLTVTATNVNIPGNVEGIYNWYVIDYDMVGNYGISTTNVFTLDTTCPSNVTLLSPTNNTITNQTTMDFVWTRAKDTLSGIAYYEIQISTNNFTSAWYNATVTITNSNISGLQYGTNWWRVRATDRAGNIGQWSSTNLFNVKIDLGVVWITNRTVGNAWNSTMLRSDPEIDKGLVALILQAQTSADAVITRIKISLDYTNGATDSDFTNFILYQDTAPDGTINGSDVTIKTDAAAVGGWITFDNITGLTIPQNTTMDFLVTFEHTSMTDTQGIKAVITGNDAVTFSVYGVSTSNSTIGSGEGTNKEVHEPGSFKILHATNWIGYINQWNDITVEVRRAKRTNEVVRWYDGVVTLDSTGIGLVEWDNISGLGIFSNITATTQGYYQFVSGDNGVVDLRLRDNTAETLNVELSSVTGITDDDTEGLLIIKYGELAYFEISHMTNYEIGTWGEVVIKAITTTHGSPVVLLDYNGIVTINVSGSGTNVDWTNSGSANGTLMTNSIGGGTYNFTLADSGVVTLYIRDSMVEAVDVDVHDGTKTDDNTHGLIYFIPLEPYIVSMSVPKNSYATVSEVNSLTLLFSRIVTPGSVMSNINFYNIDNVPYPINFSFATNVSYISQSVVTINPGLGQEEILKQFWIEIKTNIHTAINQCLVINPFDSTYNVPYYSLYTTLIDKNVGGTVTTKGKDTTLVIKNNVLPDDVYVSISDVLPSGNSIIEEANAMARANQFIKVIESKDIYKDINAFNRNLSNISTLVNSAQLYINYSDSNNDGLVDNTNILESYLKLFVLNESTKEWEVIEKSYVDTANNKVYGEIKHFSIFTIMGYYESDNFDDSFLTFPNPADIGIYTVKIKFYLEKDAKMDIKIYTITGELVRHLTKDKVLSGGMRHFIEWDGKNGVGLQVVNGVYLLKVNGEYTDGSGKISKTWKQGIVK